MGRKRKKDTHLPKRVYLQHGAYYFVDFDNKWHPLGKTLKDMYIAYSGFVDEDKPVETMKDLFDRYQREVIPEKKDRTQKDNHAELVYLRAFFDDMRPASVRTRHGYQYYNERKKKSLTRAVRETMLLSHVFTKGVEWGIVDDNPIAYKVRKEKPKPRDRRVEDWEYVAAYQVMPAMQQCAMDLALLTSARPADVLKAARADMKNEGLEVLAGKTQKKILIEWTPTLWEVVQRALKLPPHVRQPIICNRRGKPYSVDGFGSIFYRYMRKAIDDPKNPLIEPFQFKDLRAKSATDDDFIAAVQRLQHSDPKLTNEVYRRGIPKVRPLR